MSEAVSDSIDISAPADKVYAMVSDVTNMSQWSPEQIKTRWTRGNTAPKVGARFRGSNKNGWRRWSTSCKVTDATPGKRFAFRVSSYGLSVADWSYEFDAIDGGCRVTEGTTDRRGWLIKTVGEPVTGVYDRDTHNLAGIRTTLAALKAAAEKS